MSRLTTKGKRLTRRFMPTIYSKQKTRSEG